MTSFYLISVLIFISACAAVHSYASSNATVMALATRYPLVTYKHFVGSLRNTGYKGNILLILSHSPQPGVEEYLTSMGVATKRMELVDCVGPTQRGRGKRNRKTQCPKSYPNIKQRWSKYPLLRDFLEECKTCTGPALIVDARDTLFQLDPFGDGAPNVTGLQVFEECKGQKTTSWEGVHGVIKKCRKIVIDENMLCSGSTIGTREAMLQYLNIMHEEMAEWAKKPNCCCSLPSGSDDQAIHNYLYYTGRLPFAQAVANRMGIVHTVGIQANLIAKALKKEEKDSHGTPLSLSSGPTWLGLDEYGLVDEEGFLVNFDGTRSRVVHQYDRFGFLIDKFLEATGLSDDLIEVNEEI